jgi:phosphoadenosine phosphosulfate reductase
MAIETLSRLELKSRAAELNVRYRETPVEDVLTDMITRECRGKIALVSSLGVESAVLLHMISVIDKHLPVVFIDTGKHFDETIRYKDILVDRLDLSNVRVATPSDARLAAEDPDGFLHQRDPDLCCHVRKTIPLMQSLRKFDCWVTGRKRMQAATRGEIQLFEVQDRWIKINPLWSWTAEETDFYFERHGLPEHPLRESGYLSVGCAVCTQPVAAGADPRSGRWAGVGKTECGIHFENGKVVKG